MGKANDRKKKVLHNEIGGGLIPLPEDSRDFSRTAVFGSIAADELPTGDFMVAPPLEIKDQALEDFCYAYATNEVSEDQELVELEPYYTAYVAKVLIQKDPASWGCDLRTACKAHLNPYGALEKQFSPFVNYPERPTREEVLDPKSWDGSDYQMLANEHRKSTFFLVDGPHDTFDNIRAALWMHRLEFQSVLTGATWRQSWSAALGGIVKARDYSKEKGTGHAFKLCGQKIIDGEPYIVAQLSNGVDFGNGGFFYFPRDVVNKEFTYGNFQFVDIPRGIAETCIYYDFTLDAGIFKKLWRVSAVWVRDLISKLFNRN